ncbi:cobalamin synthase [compost metagenome]
MGLIFIASHLGIPVAIFAILVCAAAGQFFTAFVRRKLGGHTGDTIGATQQVSEIVLLSTLALIA